MTKLEKAILATLVYYDVLDRPLTGWEIFRYLKRISPNQKPPSLFLVLKTLERSSQLKKYIQQKNGFYFLKGQKKKIEIRIKRQKIADQKWKKVKKVAYWFQWLPFVKAILVSGSLAMHNPKKESDFDLLVITQANRIWTARALTTLFIHLIGQRRHQTLTKDRFCLNHYITDHSLEIHHQSLYNAQTYTHWVFLFGQSKIMKELEKNNYWIKNYLICGPQLGLNLLQIKESFWQKKLKGLIEKLLNGRLGNQLERILKEFQIQRIKKDPLTYQSGGRVVFNNQELEFHPDSPEKPILKKYNQIMKNLGFPELAREKDSGLAS